MWGRAALSVCEHARGKSYTLEKQWTKEVESFSAEGWVSYGEMVFDGGGGGGDAPRRVGGLSVYFVCTASDFSNEGVTEAMNESACLCGSVGSFSTPTSFWFLLEKSCCSESASPLPEMALVTSRQTLHGKGCIWKHPGTSGKPTVARDIQMSISMCYADLQMPECRRLSGTTQTKVVSWWFGFHMQIIRTGLSTAAPPLIYTFHCSTGRKLLNFNLKTFLHFKNHF